jgi:hypothetical protein
MYPNGLFTSALCVLVRSTQSNSSPSHSPFFSSNRKSRWIGRVQKLTSIVVLEFGELAPLLARCYTLLTKLIPSLRPWLLPCILLQSPVSRLLSPVSRPLVSFFHPPRCILYATSFPRNPVSESPCLHNPTAAKTRRFLTRLPNSFTHRARKTDNDACFLRSFKLPGVDLSCIPGPRPSC